LQRNQDIRLKLRGNEFREEHFQLYRRYINQRHAGGSMENPTRDDYRRFLICDWAESLFVEYRAGDDLLAVAVTDVTDTGYSAVYTFFDPAQHARSLGHVSILKQIELCQGERLPYLYLGYWVKDCQKMAYKARYRPAQGFIGTGWVDLDSLAATN
jgi:arginine-tRNA-protein transferase